jgi:hypothetical protein
VVEPMIQQRTGDADAAFAHIGEIGQSQSTRQAVAAMLQGTAAERPERILQTFGQCHEALAAEENISMLSAREGRLPSAISMTTRGRIRRGVTRRCAIAAVKEEEEADDWRPANRPTRPASRSRNYSRRSRPELSPPTDDADIGADVLR